MRDFRLFCMIVAILVQGYIIFADNIVTAAEPATATCSNCHDHLATLLPQDHAAVEDNVASCLACHSSDMPGMEKKNPFLTRIHLAHQPPRGDGDCLICHTWSAGKSFGLQGAPESWGAPTEQDMQVLQEIFASWAASANLDNSHARVSLSCANCHGTKLPQLDDTVENEKCLECHGPMEDLAKKTEPAEFKDRNPHQSHLGEIACTVCHKSHGESKVYCLGCHQKFVMPIPGEGKTKP